jgi:hypothetical protein
VANWNWCLQQARGQYIKYIFGDDRLSDPQALSKLVGSLDKNSSAILATSARQIINSDGQSIDLWRTAKKSGVIKAGFFARRCLFGVENLIGEPTAVMMRATREVFRGFDPNYRQVVDLEMWLHLLRHGDLVYIEEPLCQFRCHAGQQTEANRKEQVGYHEHISLCKKYLPHFSPPATALSFGEKHLLHRVILSLEKGKNVPQAAREIAPILKDRMGKRRYRFYRNFFWFFRKIGRPFANGHRAWRKHILKDPAYQRTRASHD